jgi:hypothetical protein
MRKRYRHLIPSTEQEAIRMGSEIEHVKMVKVEAPPTALKITALAQAHYAHIWRLLVEFLQSVDKILRNTAGY